MTGRCNQPPAAGRINAPNQSPGQPELDELRFCFLPFLAVRRNRPAFIDQGFDLPLGDSGGFRFSSRFASQGHKNYPGMSEVKVTLKQRLYKVTSSSVALGFL